MISVALIGPDGAGKTTIARMIEKSFPVPVKYLYMGVSVESSNIALPTTRLMEYLKSLRRKKQGVTLAKNVPPNRRNGKHKKSGIRAMLRLTNRLAEEWYRQFLSWNFRRKGHVVIYDRHYKFDFELDKVAAANEKRNFSDWLHRWFLANVYPAPDMVVYLDAPAEVLYARKGEFTLEWLESRRQAFLAQGQKTPNFFRIDATQPLETVYQNVTDRVMQIYQKKRSPRRTMSAAN
ncbi:MAG: Thymidylate kinase [bacterium]|nr:Thymidylate kinase [bacterium]